VFTSFQVLILDTVNHYAVDLTKLNAKSFWRRVSPAPVDCCWDWTGFIQSSGYGQIKVGGRKGKCLLTHRVAYTLTKGPVPDGQVVRHLCGNRICCNPAHLVAGTQLQNCQDTISHGRTTRGVKNARVKLTEEQVLEIYHAPGLHAPIAKRYGVTFNTVYAIKSGANWGWLTQHKESLR